MEQESTYRKFTRAELDIEYAVVQNDLSKLLHKFLKDVVLRTKSSGEDKISNRELYLSRGDGYLILESNNFDLFSVEEFRYIFDVFEKGLFPVFKHKELMNKIYFFKRNAPQLFEGDVVPLKK